jgi:starch synthase
MHILFVTAEVAPFSQATEVAESVRYLAAELKLLGHHVTIISPLYQWMDPAALRLGARLDPVVTPIQGQPLPWQVFEGRTPENVRAFFLANDRLFGRHRHIYTHPGGEPFKDNGLRFGAFCRAACEFIKQSPLPVDIIQLHDWSTALLPVFLEERYGSVDKLASCLVVQSIQDLGIQGRFPPRLLADLDLPDYLSHPNHLGTDASINFLQGGVLFSDAILTPSPSFSAEAQTAPNGFGLEPALEERAPDTFGILQGIDDVSWQPTTDAALAQTFSADQSNGKRQCKAALQHSLGLPLRPRTPLIGFISGSVPDDGLELLLAAAPDLLAQNIQLAIMGPLDPASQASLLRLNADSTRKLALYPNFDEPTLHRFIAGCDVLLTPHRIDPIGTSVLKAMRYGTLPIAHATGALRDIITDEGADSPQSSGFLFSPFTTDALLEATTRAVAAFEQQRSWRALQISAMAIPCSWKASAQAHAALYQSLL